MLLRVVHLLLVVLVVLVLVVVLLLVMLVVVGPLVLHFEALGADLEAVHHHDGGLGATRVVEGDEPEALALARPLVYVHLGVIVGSGDWSSFAVISNT